MRLFLCLLLLPAPAFAAEFTLLEADEVLGFDEVVSLTNGRRLEFYEGGVSEYSVGGSYSYTYQGGGTAYGRFNIEADGVVCVNYRNGRARCDKFVRSHGRLVMITEGGDRYPVRP